MPTKRSVLTAEGRNFLKPGACTERSRMCYPDHLRNQMKMEIVELSKRPDLIEAGIEYFWKCWGSESNFDFYKDCICHSLNEENKLPKFYLGLSGSQIIASYALLTNDIISRQDLMPWFACLYVNEDHRGIGIAERLLDHGLKEANQKGFDNLYLSTDLENFYEKKGWKHYCEGFGVSGGAIKVYSRTTKPSKT